MRGNTLFAQRFTGGVLAGRPVLLARQVASASASGTGLLAYRTAPGLRMQQLTWFNRAGRIVGTVGAPFEGFGTVELSPNGKQVALSRVVDGNEDVYLVNLADNGLTRLTFDAAVDNRALWSPDGQSIVFNSARNPSGLYLKAVNGGETERLILQSNDVSGASSWSPDGRVLMYRVNLSDFWLLPMNGHEKPIAWTATSYDEANGQFSPDGRWVAYTSNESDSYEIFVQSFHSPTKWTVSTGGGVEPRWRADGKELFYLGPDGSLNAVSITVSADGRSLAAGTPSRLFNAETYSGFTSNARIQYIVADAGQRFLVSRLLEQTSTTPITIVANWLSALNGKN